MHPVPATSSLPAIKQIGEGPLLQLEQRRSEILSQVTERTVADFAKASPELLLGEALYLERFRLKREHPNIFTRHRYKADKSIWNFVQSGLVKPSAELDRRVLLESVVRHYAGEIGGHFDPKIYKFAVNAVPFGFNWLLNAASLKHFMPWGLKSSVHSRLHILGEISMLQKLSNRGTILLVPTHQSNIDSVLIGYIIYLMQLPPFAYGAGLNLFSNPVLSFFMGRLGAYTVDRKKSNAIYKQTLKNYSTRILQEGIHSIFFPGGGRSRTGAVESRLKLGLLGTGLEAQIENHRLGKPNPSVFVVPMTMSMHFVLEASSLIEDHLAEAGKHRFIMMDDESWQAKKVANFFWKFFSSQSSLTVRIGKPLDVFGNFVDEDGRSIGPNGSTIDPVKWLTTRGELKHEAKRDREYTRELGERLSTRFHRENTVLTSHLVAFAFFEALRKKYPELDLYRFLKLSLSQRALSYEEFLKEAEVLHKRLLECESRGEVFVAPDLHVHDTETWVKDGIRHLGILHENAVVKLSSGAIWTEDMPLLYFYRNRLTGYGLSLLAESPEVRGKLGAYDRKGFLA